jgi:hypothetical protein
MCNSIPSTLSLHTLIVLSHSRRINRRRAGGLICPQPSFISPEEPRFESTGSSGSYSGVPTFPAAVQLSIGLCAGSPYSPEPTRLLCLSFGTPPYDPLPTDRSMSLGRGLGGGLLNCGLKPQSGCMWAGLLRRISNSFLLVSSQTSFPVDIQSGGVISYPPHQTQTCWRHLSVGGRG